MLIAGFPAGAWGTNCYVVAPAAGEECVDRRPGPGRRRGRRGALREHGLKPVASCSPTGTSTTSWSVVPVCGAHDIPACIHPDDRYMLTDPARALGRARSGAQLMGELTVRRAGRRARARPTASVLRARRSATSPSTTLPAIPGGR